jgi:hypothetical protein
MKFPKADIRSPHDFAAMAQLVRAEDFEGRMIISADPDVHRAYIQTFFDAGIDKIYLHNVGRNQRSSSRCSAATSCPPCTAENPGGTR